MAIEPTRPRRPVFSCRQLEPVARCWTIVPPPEGRMAIVALTVYHSQPVEANAETLEVAFLEVITALRQDREARWRGDILR